MRSTANTQMSKKVFDHLSKHSNECSIWFERATCGTNCRGHVKNGLIPNIYSDGGRHRVF